MVGHLYFIICHVSAFCHILLRSGFSRCESDWEPLQREMILDNLRSIQPPDPKAEHEARGSHVQPRTSKELEAEVKQSVPG